MRLAGAAHDLGPVSSLPPSPGAENGLLAGASALLAGASPGAIARALAGWKGLALRRERARRVDGSDVIRDALAATPAKAAAGLALHPPGSVILIAGGYDDLGGGPMHSAPRGARALRARRAGGRARLRARRALRPRRRRASPRRSPAAGLASVAVHATLAERRGRRPRSRRARPDDRVRARGSPTTPGERADFPGLLGL